MVLHTLRLVQDLVKLKISVKKGFFGVVLPAPLSNENFFLNYIKNVIVNLIFWKPSPDIRGAYNQCIELYKKV